MKMFVWDTETTGINSQVDRLVEIAAMELGKDGLPLILNTGDSSLGEQRAATSDSALAPAPQNARMNEIPSLNAIAPLSVPAPSASTGPAAAIALPTAEAPTGPAPVADFNPGLPRGDANAAAPKDSIPTKVDNEPSPTTIEPPSPDVTEQARPNTAQTRPAPPQ